MASSARTLYTSPLHPSIDSYVADTRTEPSMLTVRIGPDPTRGRFNSWRRKTNTEQAAHSSRMVSPQLRDGIILYHLGVS